MSGTRTPSKVSSAVAWPRRPSLPWISRAGQARAVGRHQERGDAAAARAAGAGEDQRDLGPGAVGDEHLRAGRAPSRRRRGRPGWSGSPASEPVPGSVSAKQPSASPAHSRGSHSPLLLLGAVARRSTWPTRPSETDTMPRTDESPRPSSSSHEAVREVVAAGAAVLLGDGQAEEAERRRASPTIAAVDLLGPVPVGGVRRDLAVDELGGEVADGRVLFAERQFHLGPFEDLRVTVRFKTSAASFRRLAPGPHPREQPRREGGAIPWPARHAPLLTRERIVDAAARADRRGRARRAVAPGGSPPARA